MQPEDLYADAERVEHTDDEGVTTRWVVLAEATLDGDTYVLVADEVDLSPAVEDMAIAVFRRSGGARRLDVIDDEATEDRVFDHFTELMGLEGA